MNNIETVSEALTLNKYNPNFALTARLPIADRTREVIFRVTRTGSIMAMLPDSKNTAIACDAATAFRTLTRYELQTMRAKTLREVETFSRKPGFVRAQFSNALEARLGRIERLISEANHGI